MIPNQQQRGFTLIQLAAALTMVSIAVAVFVPDMIAGRRVQLAERSVREMNAIMDAARWFYVASDEDDVTQRRWPGRQPVNAGTGTCDTNGASAWGELNTQFPNLPRTDPWGGAYQIRFIGPGTCNLSVQTQINSIPSELYPVFAGNLPNNGCGNFGTNVCAATPMPGKEAALEDVQDGGGGIDSQFVPLADDVGNCLRLGETYSGRCGATGCGVETYTCNGEDWVPAGDCLSDGVAEGNPSYCSVSQGWVYGPYGTPARGSYRFYALYAGGPTLASGLVCTNCDACQYYQVGCNQWCKPNQATFPVPAPAAALLQCDPNCPIPGTANCPVP